MATIAKDSVVARPKGRPRSERNDVTVKVDRAVVSMAKVIADSRGIPLAELLTGILEGPISKAYAARMRELESKG